MDPTRRTFLRIGFIGLGFASAVSGAWTMRAQDRPRKGLHPPDPAEPPRMVLRPTTSPRLSPGELRDRAAELRSSLDQLCHSAEALREEVGGLELTQVFSLKVYKEAESLEKLGKKLKTLSKL